MDTSQTRNDIEDPQVDTSVYYGVYIPNTVETQPSEEAEKRTVFTDKIEALKLVKKCKKARFKRFSYYHEAIEFATHGCEILNNVSFTSGYNNQKKDGEKETSLGGVGEKCQFRGPKPQDIVKLRKAIESNDLNFVEKTVWDNPRYLISSGDTPSILQEGSRYNPLHIAAKSKHPEMCELILNTIGNKDFIEKLYGDEPYQNSEDRIEILLDLYLNTPDKGLNETPLHFAVKFGALKVAEVLVSYPQCNRNVRNKYGKLPSQIICDRCDGYCSERLRREIGALLEDNYYVPVLRYEDNCNPPAVGKPFSPKSPPNLDTDSLTRLEIHAYAGPMDKESADKFRQIWKTPPRSIVTSTSIRRSKVTSPETISVYDLKMNDPEKGLEAVGRELATKYNVGWKEYWPFLDSFVDICSEEGLRQFEEYLRSRIEKDFLLSRNEEISSPKLESEVIEIKKELSKDSIDSLCEKFTEFCIINENGVCPFVCAERSLEIFSNRVCKILNLCLSDDENQSLNNFNLLLGETKHFEHLIASYIDDISFAKINFQSAHSRLANLILTCFKDHTETINFNNLKTKLEKLIDSCSSSKHSTCILNNIIRSIDEETDDSTIEAKWEKADKCDCIFNPKQNKHKYSLRRKKNGIHLNNGSMRNNFNGVQRNLFQVDNSSDNSDASFSEDEEEFYTAPSSPIPMETDFSDEDDNFDIYDDCLPPNDDIYIEGSHPTKADRDIFNALKYADAKLTPDRFPYIYRWRHAVSLFTEEDRKGWSSPKCERGFSDLVPNKMTSTPCRNPPSRRDLTNTPPSLASPKSWLRVTGPYSPKASLNGLRRTSLSFNM